MSAPASKPWYRLRNIALGFLALFLVFICWAGYWVYWALTVEPNPSTDYAAQLEQLSRDAQPPGENGWPDIMLAIAIFERLEHAFPKEERAAPLRESFQFEFLYDPAHKFAEWAYFEAEDVTDDQIRAELVRALEWLEAQGAWNALADAAAKPNIVRPIDVHGAALIDLLLPDVASLRGMAKARRATLRLAIDQGDVVQAQRSLRDLLTLARAAGSQAILINGLVAMSIRALAYDVIQQSFAIDSPDAALARALLDILSASPPPPDASLYFEGERRFFLDIVQHFHSDDGRGDGVLLVAKLDPLTSDFGIAGMEFGGGGELRNLLGLLMASRAEVVAKANEVYDEFVRLCQSNDASRWDEMDDLTNTLPTLGHRHLLINLMLPAVGKGAESLGQVRMQHDAMRIMLAIELYRAAHGSPPRSLVALVPEFLESVPTDPVTYTSFGYKLLESDEHGRDYLLYTFGRDGEDNGGTELDFGEPHDAFRSGRGAGFDFVINRPPPTAQPD